MEGEEKQVAEKKRKSKNDGPSAPSWMVTYSDMVTLLLTFFVLMLSMSNVDKVKFQKAAGSLKGAFGIMQSKTEVEQKSEAILPRFEAIPFDMMQRVYKKMIRNLEKLDLNRDIEIVKDRGAIILRIKEKILFATGSDKLKGGAEPVLRKVAELVSPLPFEMRIEGHTDNVAYTGSDVTNWDLSVQRAITVLGVFARSDLLPLDRLSAVGYGDQKPLVPNDTPENRALNRRVEFVLEPSGGYRQELPYLIDTTEQLPF